MNISAKKIDDNQFWALLEINRTFISRLAHDFNNKFNITNFILTDLTEELSTERQVIQELESAKKTLNEYLEIISNYSRIIRYKDEIKPYDLNDIIKDTLYVLEKSFKASMLKTNIQLGEVYADVCPSKFLFGLFFLLQSICKTLEQLQFQNNELLIYQVENAVIFELKSPKTYLFQECQSRFPIFWENATFLLNHSGPDCHFDINQTQFLKLKLG